ncbi:MAG TPA: hypothetical protein DCZ10_02240 [Pelotomaculum sp.]|nr:hypothetical protein [Pelotomaculum sp.]
MKRKKIALLLLVSLLSGLMITGCGKQEQSATGTQANNQDTPVILGHVGSVCEAPLFIAYEKGFFQEKGVNVELSRIPEGADKKEILATNKNNVTDGVLQTWLKALEQGVDMKFTGGTHTGCISMVALSTSNINSATDLKGKIIGVSGAIGGGTMNYAYRALIKAGLDPQKDVTWKAYPSAQLLTALQKGEIDAAANGDTMNFTWAKEGSVKIIASMATDPGTKEEICCLIAFNSGYIAQNPEKAKAVTEAINKATKWTKENPEEAVRIMLDKKYTLGTQELNTEIIKSYDFNPSTEAAKSALYTATKEFKEAGILGPDVDPDAFVQKYFVDIPGLED